MQVSNYNFIYYFPHRDHGAEYGYFQIPEPQPNKKLRNAGRLIDWLIVFRPVQEWAGAAATGGGSSQAGRGHGDWWNKRQVRLIKSNSPGL